MPSARRAPRRGPAWWVVAAALAMALVVVTVTTSFLLRPAQTVQEFALSRVVPEVHSTQVVTEDRAEGLHLYLVPHADDELSGWTSLAEGSDLYPVLVLLTQGEQTIRCTAEGLQRHLQAELGEEHPTPDPTTGRDTPACRQARWNAFQESLREASEHTPSMDLTDAQEVTTTVGGDSATVVRGSGVTVIALDLGDTQLTPESVREAVDHVLALAGTELPDLPLTRITSSAYVGADATGSKDCAQPALCPDGEQGYGYAHDDHRATHEAARALAPRATEGAFLVTHPYDPAANEHRALPPKVYDAFMELGPGDADSARRLGSHQRIYGWLAFPDVWRVGELPLQSTEVFFSRVQSYEVFAP
ncbi:hypothetical protein [Ornithinimicrobium sediminis]|uniref:hypothetical protein n=1 Tax=Ornithinimicrobium sediminis TaxID=2904603 RepID=UPI001E486734|nr:hypothetical protein [Ornithinimicrobium sediminis]MCE0485707.1 hypothetical protein [Ornithinimicrobium sediminis]